MEFEQMIEIFGASEQVFLDIRDTALGLIADVLPIVLPVMGAIVVVGIGVKVFKRFVK